MIAYLRDVPGKAGEDNHGDGHDNSDDPVSIVNNRFFYLVMAAMAGRKLAELWILATNAARELLVKPVSIMVCYFKLHSASLQLVASHVPEGPVASIGGLLILGERGHDGRDGSHGARARESRGGRGQGLDRVDDHDEGSVV